MDGSSFFPGPCSQNNRGTELGGNCRSPLFHLSSSVCVVLNLTSFLAVCGGRPFLLPHALSHAGTVYFLGIVLPVLRSVAPLLFPEEGEERPAPTECLLSDVSRLAAFTKRVLSSQSPSLSISDETDVC